MELVRALDAQLPREQPLTWHAEEENLGAAVCLMQGDHPSKVKGVVRMIQLSQKAMLFEAAFSGLPPCSAPPCSKFPLQVHASGDITEGTDALCFLHASDLTVV